MNVSYTAGHNKNEEWVFSAVYMEVRFRSPIETVGDVFKGTSAVIADRSKLVLVVPSSKLQTAPRRSLTLLGFSIGVCEN